VTPAPKAPSTKAPQTAEDALRLVLVHIERQAGRTDSEAAYGSLLAVPGLPLEALSELGPLTRLDTPGPDSLPSLLLETGGGQVQIELCPFGPLVLLSSDGAADTDPLAQILHDSGLFPLFPADVDGGELWHGHPLARWLFPPRLSLALELFETLRE
jgi:hypothetical protein